MPSLGWFFAGASFRSRALPRALDRGFIATPLLAVAFAMSGARQAIACGIIFYLFATWEQRRTLAKVAFVLFAGLFHFSAVFVLLSSPGRVKGPPVVKPASAAAAGSGPCHREVRAEFHGSLFAPLCRRREQAERAGRLVQVGTWHAAGALYLFNREMDRGYGRRACSRTSAGATLACLPVIPISSVGRLPLRPLFLADGMYLYSGFPGLIQAARPRLLSGSHRHGVVRNADRLVAPGQQQPALAAVPNWLLLPDTYAPRSATSLVSTYPTSTGDPAGSMLVLCPYPLGVAAGQRLKFEQYYDDWRRLGWDVTVSPYMDLAALVGCSTSHGHLSAKSSGRSGD